LIEEGMREGGAVGGAGATVGGSRTRRTVYLVFATVFMIAVVELGLQLSVQQRVDEAIEASTSTTMLVPSRLPSLIDVVVVVDEEDVDASVDEKEAEEGEKDKEGDGDGDEEHDKSINLNNNILIVNKKKAMWNSIVLSLQTKEVLLTRLALLKLNEPHWRRYLLERELTAKEQHPSSQLRVTIHHKKISRNAATNGEELMRDGGNNYGEEEEEGVEGDQIVLSDHTQTFDWWLPCLPYQYPTSTSTSTSTSANKQPLVFAIIATIDHQESLKDHLHNLWSTLEHQTYTHWRLFLVVYNHEKKGTGEDSEIDEWRRSTTTTKQHRDPVVVVTSQTTDGADALNTAIDLAQMHNLTHVVPLDPVNLCHHNNNNNNDDNKDDGITAAAAVEGGVCWSSEHLFELAKAYLDFPDAVVVYSSKARDRETATKSGSGTSSSDSGSGSGSTSGSYNQNSLFVSSEDGMSWRMDRLPAYRYRTTSELATVVGSDGDYLEDLRERIADHLLNTNTSMVYLP